MASGINDDKINQLKVKLLDYIESLNSLSNRMDTCYQNIGLYMDGPGKSAILNRLKIVKDQMPVVVFNVNSYITDLNRVINSYKKTDAELSSQLMSNIEKVSYKKGE